jgi:hypothetical protein
VRTAARVILARRRISEDFFVPAFSVLKRTSRDPARHVCAHIGGRDL